jgi:hypothetical protein
MQIQLNPLVLSQIYLKKISNINWILDSGATDHMIGNKKLLSNYKHFEGEQFIIVVNGDKIKILGIGSINIFFKNNSQCSSCEQLCIQLIIY